MTNVGSTRSYPRSASAPSSPAGALTPIEKMLARPREA